MKAWLSHFLYPMNLWSRFVICCGTLIKLYDKWIWQSFLEKWLCTSLDPTGDEDIQLATHICVQCGRRVKLALVVCEGASVDPFCSLKCKEMWVHSNSLKEDSETIQQPST